MKRGTMVKRKDNGQCGIVYKDSGDILSVIVTSGICGKQYPNLGIISTWHKDCVEECWRLYSA